MAVRLLIGTFGRLDGEAIEDFELLPVGPITQTPQVIGNGGVELEIGTFAPRI